MLYFAENDTISLQLRTVKVLHQETTPYHEVQLFLHSQLGKILVIDDEIQHIEAFAPLYHEMLIHLPASFIENIHTVLILGGGSLYAAQEALRYPGADVVMVDHDPNILGIIRRFYAHGNAVINNPRFHHVAADAAEFIDSNKSCYDLIANDCFDLYSLRERWKNPFRVLSSQLTGSGVCSDIIYRHIFDGRHKRGIFKQLCKSGTARACSLIVVPEYPGILHVLTMWGINPNISQRCPMPINKIQQNWLSCEGPCEIYNPQYLAAYLHLPRYLRNRIELGEVVRFER